MGKRTDAILITALFLFSTTSAFGRDGTSLRDNCWVAAGKTFDVDPILLYSIAEAESSHNPKSISKPNRNGTHDIGLMQVNTSHLPKLREKGITKKDLLNPCLNIFIGAFLLVDAKRVMGSFWEGVGAYNAGNRKGAKYDRLRKKYTDRIRPIYERNLRMLDKRNNKRARGVST